MPRLLPIAAAVIVLLVAGCATPEALPRRHMVVAGHPLAAAAGREMLRAGGSAVDAAIAAQMVLTLVEPQSSGIGGGAFLLNYRRADRRIDAYDGRETAPASADARMFLAADGRPLAFPGVALGGRSVGVPGVVRMLALAHRDHGRLAWARLFQPAIALAETGFALSPRLHAMLSWNPFLKTLPNTAAYFYQADGSPKPVGTQLANPALARTLRSLAEHGAEAFYQGAIARDIAAAVRGAPVNPGGMTEADIAAYQAKRRDALCRPYRVWRICAMGPPTAGGVTVLEILGLLERFDLGALAPGSAEAVHAISEASRLAYADRNAFIADPDFVANPIAGLLDPAYLAARSATISAARSIGTAAAGAPHGVAPPPAEPAREGPSTTHLSIIDGDGNAVAMTSSVEGPFGAQLMVRGFMLNNQLTDFAFRPEIGGRPVANRVEPGKRPRSSMAPVVVFDGDGNLILVLGSPGGNRIIAYVAQTLIAALDWGLDIERAVALPRHVNLNGATELEAGTPVAALKDRLEALGHRIELAPLTSGLGAIRVTASGYRGAADPRREGVALGD